MQQAGANKGTLKALQIIHRAMLLGIVLFSAVAFFLNYSGNFSPALQEYDQVLQVISIVLAVTGFFLGNFFFKKKIFQLRQSADDLQTKQFAFYAASILQWALIEGPALFAVICFLLVGNYAFLALAIVLMLLFVVNAPTKIKMAMLLQMNEEEIN
jgi:hypothetical protein